MNEDIVRKYTDKQVIMKLFSYLKPELKSFILALLLVVVVVLIGLIPSYITGLLFDIINSNLDNAVKMQKLIVLILGFSALVLLSFGLSYINSIMLNKIGQKILYRVRNDVFNHIESLDIAIINSEPIGRLVSRVTNDTNSLNEFFTNILVQLLRNVITLIGVVIIMIAMSPMLSLYVFIIIPILLGITILFKKLSKKAYQNVKMEQSAMNAFLSENISGMKIIQVYNQEERKYDEFSNRNKSLKKASYKEVLIFGIFQPLIYVLYLSGETLAIYLGVQFISAGILAPYLFVAFYNYIHMLFRPIQNTVDQFNMIQQTFVSCERIMTILDMKNKINDDEDAIELDHFEGKIEFRNVSFAYVKDNWILKNVSFVINPMDTVAFVGATGAGKTTILSLLVRNYDVNEGEILIDDINIKKIKISSLRRLIGQMLQDVFLFEGTIKSNITLDDPNISDEEVIKASNYVNLDKFVKEYPDGFMHHISERGQNFSAGQRQLISFARTIAHKPNIMILDEATANIDTETEILIQESLNKMKNIGTMLIVAHRLSTIKNADKIIVLHKGEVIEMGNHEELLEKKGLYYNLYKIQFLKEEV